MKYLTQILYDRYSSVRVDKILFVLGILVWLGRVTVCTLAALYVLSSVFGS